MESMERREVSPFSPRARKLFGRAFSVGVDPVHIKNEAQKAIEVARVEGRQRVTRGDLKNLEDEVKTLILDVRRQPEPGFLDPTDASL